MEVLEKLVHGLEALSEGNNIKESDIIGKLQDIEKKF